MRPATITSLRLSTDRVDVTGLQTAEVDVEARIVSPDVDPDSKTEHVTVQMLTSKTPPKDHNTPWSHAVGLNLVSGTRRDGLWRGTYHLRAVAAGTWTVECVMTPGTYRAAGFACAPHEGVEYPSLVVVGHHVPQVSVEVSPEPIRTQKTLAVKGRLIDTETGAPLAGVRLYAVTWSVCGEVSAPDHLEVADTAADGSYAMTVSPKEAPNICVYVPMTGTSRYEGSMFLAAAEKTLRYTLVVTAKAATPRVRLTGNVHVTGKVTFRCNPRSSPALVASLQLQRLTKSGWVTVSKPKTTPSSAFSLYAPAAALGGTRGIQFYRVVVPDHLHFVRSASPVIRVRVT